MPLSPKAAFVDGAGEIVKKRKRRPATASDEEAEVGDEEYFGSDGRRRAGAPEAGASGRGGGRGTAGRGQGSKGGAGTAVRRDGFAAHAAAAAGPRQLVGTAQLDAAPTLDEPHPPADPYDYDAYGDGGESEGAKAPHATRRPLPPGSVSKKGRAADDEPCRLPGGGAGGGGGRGGATVLVQKQRGTAGGTPPAPRGVLSRHQLSATNAAATAEQEAAPKRPSGGRRGAGGTPLPDDEGNNNRTAPLPGRDAGIGAGGAAAAAAWDEPPPPSSSVAAASSAVDACASSSAPSLPRSLAAFVCPEQLPPGEAWVCERCAGLREVWISGWHRGLK